MPQIRNVKVCVVVCKGVSAICWENLYYMLDECIVRKIEIKNSSLFYYSFLNRHMVTLYWVTLMQNEPNSGQEEQHNLWGLELYNL